jgi:hypothetical protein
VGAATFALMAVALLALFLALRFLILPRLHALVGWR